MPGHRHLELIVPGLLGPVTDADAVAQLAPELPVLARLLSRARLQAECHADSHASLMRAFGVAGPPWPVAAAARAGEGDAAPAPEGWWLRADPVHLRVDTTHARLFGAHALALTRPETDALTARLNAFLAADGLRIEAPAPDRWYLACERAFDLQAHAPERVAGRNVDAFLPAGDDARAWRGWLNEVQMLLHDAPVNSDRAAQGALPVNSVWLWGGGYAPRVTDPPERVFTADPLGVGLARQAAVACQEPPGDLGSIHFDAGRTLLAGGDLLMPLVHGEIEGWLDALARLERAWFAPLLEALRQGRCDRVDILPADGRRFCVGRAELRRFWRRTQGWTHWLAAEQP
jgi:hypothetical protein